jgi:hypothetical protein
MMREERGMDDGERKMGEESENTESTVGREGLTSYTVRTE